MKSERPAPEINNIQTIIDLERQSLGERTLTARLIDAVSSFVSRPLFIVIHLIWFGTWIGLNQGAQAFDPFPYSLLTLAIAIETIVLTGFVLMAQSRMTLQADRRAHLDLQINVLGEQELTAILRMQCRIAERLGIDVAACEPTLHTLLRHTDVRELAGHLDRELAAVESEDTGANASGWGHEKPPKVRPRKN
jgi:uncharacterized membrane protein